MTVHPFPSAAPGGRDPLGGAGSADEADAALARLDRVLAEFTDRLDDEHDDGAAELLDGLDDGANRFGSFDVDHRLAHRAITPGLLAGLCRLDVELCKLFHAVVFELLEDIGEFDGLIATPDFFVDAGPRRMRSVNGWMFDHPAPADDDRLAGRNAIADHSHELAVAIESNPSLTFASTAALHERLLDGILDLGPCDLVVFDQQLAWLTDLTFRLLAELRDDVVTAGRVQVWAAEPLRSS